MELNQKLQELRKKKGLTQEELAERLYVSRTAVSKWESGRGYPSIDSLKRIATVFSVSIDELLSSEELLTIAEEDTQKKEKHFRDLIYGIVDCSVAMFLFLPFFAYRVGEIVFEASLLSLREISPVLIGSYFALVIAIIASGILTLAFGKFEFWSKIKIQLSLALNIIGVLLFMISFQPYAAIYLFICLIMKSVILLKKQ